MNSRLRQDRPDRQKALSFDFLTLFLEVQLVLAETTNKRGSRIGQRTGLFRDFSHSPDIVSSPSEEGQETEYREQFSFELGRDN